MNYFINPDFFLAQGGAAAPTGDAAAPAAGPAPAPASTATGTSAPAPAAAPASDAKGTATATGDGIGEPREKQQPQPGIEQFLLPGVMIVGLIGLFWFMSRSRKKQQKQMEEMYSGLKRDDRIMLQSGKLVVVDSVDKDTITVFADTDRRVKEQYHRNSVAGKADKYLGAATGDKK